MKPKESDQKPNEQSHGRQFTPLSKFEKDHLIATTLFATFSDADQMRMTASHQEQRHATEPLIDGANRLEAMQQNVPHKK